MGRPRELDWDEVQRLYDEIGTYYGVAKRLGCAIPSVKRIVNPHYRAHKAAWQREKKPHQGVCPECGGPATNRFPSDQRGLGVCRACMGKRFTTTVRETTLRCSCCGLWLPDQSFPHQASKKARRYRHGICTPCGNVMKRDWRKANAERLREYERERPRRRKAKS